jgi:Zn-dependent peptidase ImmA (M78 family)/transcriptional regulator with XRE-family HTH domain
MLTVGGKIEVPITPAVLRWAREEAGFTTAELADAIKTDSTKISAWENGVERPGKTAFKKLGTALGRSEAVFFLPQPPRSTSPLPVFRKAVAASEHRALEQVERRAVREARRVQSSMRWVSEESRPTETVDIPDVKGLPASRAAQRVRKWLDWSVQKQTSSPTADVVVRKLREALHAKGIFVLHKSLRRDGIRGFALWDDRAPLICVNTAQTAPARVFTMAHELAHLARRDVAVDTGALVEHGDKVERWCEEFAAAFLLPKSAVEAEMARKDVERVFDLNTASRLAKRFRVSLRAMVLRLAALGHADGSLYGMIPRAGEFKAAKDEATGPPMRSRVTLRWQELGELYVSRLADAQDDGVIGKYDVLEFLDVTGSDLVQLREKLASSESAS